MLWSSFGAISVSRKENELMLLPGTELWIQGDPSQRRAKRTTAAPRTQSCRPSSSFACGWQNPARC